MEKTYFVGFYLYNGENKGWAYNIELKTTSKDEAIRKFGKLIDTYYGKAHFVYGCIYVNDMYGNIIERKYWDNRTPEPTPEIEE